MWKFLVALGSVFANITFAYSIAVTLGPKEYKSPQYYTGMKRSVEITYKNSHLDEFVKQGGTVTLQYGRVNGDQGYVYNKLSKDPFHDPDYEFALPLKQSWWADQNAMECAGNQCVSKFDVSLCDRDGSGKNTDLQFVLELKAKDGTIIWEKPGSPDGLGYYIVNLEGSDPNPTVIGERNGNSD